MRNYSHFVVGGEWIPLSKAHKRRMRELLPTAELAVIAHSGQKHLLFRARKGLWQFEEQQIVPDWPRLEGLLEAVEGLYSAFSKAEIETGVYSPSRIMAFGLREWREAERLIRPERGGSLWGLAIFLAQREEEGDGHRGEGGEDRTGRPSEHGLVGVGEQTSEVLADPDGQRAERGLHEQPDEVHQLALL
jgi:hypothetical protein